MQCLMQGAYKAKLNGRRGVWKKCGVLTKINKVASDPEDLPKRVTVPNTQYNTVHAKGQFTHPM
jgi:hypothetical protein